MDKDTDLERLRAWLATYPGYDILGNMLVDYIDEIPGAASLMPAGLVEIGRTEDILGNITAQNQYNFGLYLALEKSPGDDIASAYNAGWVLDFQRWVQAQSVAHAAPTFGNIDQRQESIKAQNGALLDTDENGVAVYIVQLSAEFKTRYEVNG